MEVDCILLKGNGGQVVRVLGFGAQSHWPHD